MKFKALKSFKLKSFKLLFWLGPVLLIMGLTAGLVANQWGAIPLGLAIAGFALILVWLLTEGTSKNGFFSRRSTQASTNALIATVAVLVILGLVNFLAVQYSSRVDLTENRLFTLAPQSKEVVQSVEQPVKVWVFAATPDPMDRALLENYQRQNSQFSFEYVDPQAQPGVSRRFGAQNFGDVFIEAGEQRRLVQNTNPQERLSERRLTNAIAQIASSGPSKVYFLQGHGERSLTPGQGGLSQAIAQLSEENYTAEPLNLAETPQVPEDASVVVLAGPQRELLEAEVRALQEFLKRRSGLMVMIDPQIDPGLDPLLNAWGVSFQDRLIIDPAGQATGLGLGTAIVNEYGDHPITREFNTGISFYSFSRPVEIEPKSAFTATPLLFTSDRTQAGQVAEDGNLTFAEEGFQGPFTIGYALSRELETATPAATSPEAATPEAATPEAATPEAIPGAEEPEARPQARMVAIGNSSFVTDGQFGQQLNGDVFLNAISWLSQQDDQALSIRPATMTNRRILLSMQQQILIGVLALGVLPFLGIAAALFLWWRKR